MTELTDTKKRKWWVYLILGAIVIVCGCVFLLIVFGSSGSKTTTTGPTLDVRAIYTQAYWTSIAALPTKTSIPPHPTYTNIPSTVVTIPTVESVNSANIIIDVPSILGKSVREVENLLGKTTLITPMDNLAGGEYRDYQIDRYTVSIAYDKTRIARVFFILDGISEENYALKDWNIILLKFGVQVSVSPNRIGPRGVYYWDNYDGLFIAVAGQPVYTVQIAQAEYHP